MRVNTTKPRLIFSAIITAALLFFIIIGRNEFIKKDVYLGTLLFILSIVCSLLIGIINALKLKLTITSERIIYTVLFLLLPVVSITMTECLNSVFVYNFSYANFLNNYLLYLLFYLLIFAISGSYRISVLVINPIIIIFGLANFYIYKFKGSPFIPMDFLSISTAKEVANTYDFSPDYKVIVAVVLFAAILVIGAKLKTPKFSKTIKIIERVVSALLFIGVTVTFLFTDLFADIGLKPDFWNQSRGYHNSGFLLNFCLNTKYMYVLEPAGYDAEKVEQLVSDMNNDTSCDEVSKANPNIICIMNESFADLSVCGEFTTNKDVLKNYNSINNNAIKGNLYVPIHGSGTSNTEYEFLTGNSTSFFPSGSNAFMLYVKRKTDSIVSTVQENGYSANAFHPYYSSGWNRNNVYPLLGFEKFDTITSIINPSILLDYIRGGYDDEKFIKDCNENYPGENILFRQYVNDYCNYDYLIADFESRDVSKPYYMFNITMQNHGSYTSKLSNFEEDVHITSTKNKYPMAEQYFSLLRQSDIAFGNLIEYFNTVKEPTVICMFGDHQPNIEEGFYKEIMGVDSLDDLSEKQLQSRYITPFIIWANYDIDEEYIDKLSANYLSSYVMKIAGLQMPEYNKYLYNLSKIVPVINNVGYIGDDGKYYKNSSDSKYTKYIDSYKKIQYNNVFDVDNRKRKLFNLND